MTLRANGKCQETQESDDGHVESVFALERPWGPPLPGASS